VGEATTSKRQEEQQEEQLGLFDHKETSAFIDVADWRVRVSGRARNLKIQVYPHGGVEIVAPKRARPAEIEAFIAEHRDWIRKTRSRFQALRPPEPTLPATIELQALGKEFRTHFVVGESAKCRERDGLLSLAAPELNPEHCWPLLRDWLKKQGRQHLIAETQQLANETGLSPERVHVRLQRTRWGSCSTSGTISLNAAALLRPRAEMRYVIIHELCHLQHMNHSKRFWKLVESFVPEYKSLEKTLDAAWQTSPRWLIG
jgi:predicted metal-dependent hydrolase